MPPVNDRLPKGRDVDLDEFERKPVRDKLKIDHLLESMDEDTRSIVLQALTGPTDRYPAATIAKTLTKHGFTVSDTAIHNWRDRHQNDG